MLTCGEFNLGRKDCILIDVPALLLSYLFARCLCLRLVEIPLVSVYSDSNIVVLLIIYMSKIQDSLSSHVVVLEMVSNISFRGVKG